MREPERLAEIDLRAAQRHEAVSRELARISEALQLLIDDDPTYRRLLTELRASEAYERPFVESEPMVTVVTPTWDRLDSLVELAIPSVLAQSYSNVEALVVGDGIPADRARQTEAALAALGDPRVRFINTTYNGPYPNDPKHKWMMIGTPPLNHGFNHARGDWLTLLDDDDAFRPQALERLVGLAQRERVEFAYGALLMHHPQGGQDRLGVFPPAWGQVGLQSGIFHGGLRFIPIEPAHQLFSLPNDVGFIRRLMRLGVSMAMLDEVVADYYTSGVGDGAFDDEVAEGMASAVAQADARAAAALARAAAAEAAVADALARVEAAESRAATVAIELETARHWNDILQSSRSWQLTRPLRYLGERSRARE